MNDRPAWHADPAFWNAFEPFVFPSEKVEQAREQVERLVDLLDLDPGSAVLDMPCGVGRHAIPLADRGFCVTAVDSTPSYLETARERAAAADVMIEFVEQDMREFEREAAFDAACNLYTSFGYFDERADDERVARNFHTSLKPGGALVMSLASKETLAGRFRARAWEERDGTYMLEEHEIAEDWSRMENRWILVDRDGDAGDGDGANADTDVQEFEFSHRLYSAFELAELLRGVGFSEVDTYGDFEGSDFDEDAEQLVIVARE